MLSQRSEKKTQEYTRTKERNSPEVKIKSHETKNNKSEFTNIVTDKSDDPTTRTTQQDDENRNSQSTQRIILEENQILITDSIKSSDDTKSQTLQVPVEEFRRSLIENYSSDGGSIRYEFDIMDTKQTEKETSFDNAYSTKKTVVQGMMDLALVTANANQLRTQLEYGSPTVPFHQLIVVFCIVLSLIIQITVGVILIVFRRKMHPPLDCQEKPLYIKRIDNFVLTGVFLVTVLNVFIAAFTTFQDRKTSH